MAATGTGRAQIPVLACLADHTPRTAPQIAAHTHLSICRVYSALWGLLHSGLVTRDDNRPHRYQISETGHAATKGTR